MTRKSFRTLIIMCWVVLLVCVVIKLFGGNWFEFATDNARFIEFCEMVEYTKWLKMTLYCIIAVITTYPVICVILNKKYLNKKETLIFVPLIITKSLTSWYVPWLPYILDSLCVIVLPLLLTRFKCWKRVIIGNVLVLVFQLITFVIRNLSINFVYNNAVLEILLYQIDYYVMIALFYLYNSYINFKKKEGK